MKHSGIVLALAIMLNWCVPLAASGTQANEVSMDNAPDRLQRAVSYFVNDNLIENIKSFFNNKIT